MKSFEELYNEFKSDEEVSQASKEVIEERKKANKIILTLCLILNLCIIACFILKKIEFQIFYMPPMIMANLIIIIITSVIFSKKQKEFNPIFKENIIKKMINNFFNNIEYFPNKNMPSNIYREGQYESYDIYSSDDYIEAKIDSKYYIDMAEVHTEKEETYEDSDGDTHTRTYTIFHGIFAKINMDKSIKSSLRITPNRSGYKDKLEMDSSEFEKIFDVFASDKIIGMQLLTADIMEEIIEFKNKYKDYFDILINENNIYLRFHCGIMFEPKLSKKELLDEKSLKKYYNILEFIYELSNKLIKVVNETEI